MGLSDRRSEGVCTSVRGVSLHGACLRADARKARTRPRGRHAGCLAPVGKQSLQSGCLFTAAWWALGPQREVITFHRRSSHFQDALGLKSQGA